MYFSFLIRVINVHCDSLSPVRTGAPSVSPAFAYFGGGGT
jgi:hypothetical protein